MLFPSVQFGIFFPIVLALSWALMSRPFLWKPFILLASYVFYAAASPTFCVLLAGVTVWNHYAALLIDRTDSDRRTSVFFLTDPQAGPGFSISGCRAACPANGLAIWSPPAWLPTFNDVAGALLIAVPIATAGVLVWRLITGTPPRRRALATGAPIACCSWQCRQATKRSSFFPPTASR